MHVLLAAGGSRGDTQPMVALGVALARAGHQVVLGATRHAAEDAAHFGLEFHPVGHDLQAELRERKETFGTLSPLQAFRALNALAGQELRDQFRQLAPLAASADLLVSAGAQASARSLAELHGRPHRTLVYSPEIFFSLEHAPLFFPWRMPRLANAAAWAMTQWFYTRLLQDAYAGERRARGLSGAPNVLDNIFDPSHAIPAMDPELAPLPGDVRTASAPVGALHLPDERPLDDRVEAFLGRGPPPVYVGFGSMPDARPERTTPLLVEAFRRAGVRGIISSGWAALGHGVEAQDVLTVGSVNHQRLFPRCAAIVHHGGAGTTSSAARAGVPQIVVPHAFDQYGWGRRVAARGLGPPPFARGRLSAARLARSIRAATADPRIVERAAALGERLRQRDALALAVCAVEAAAR